MSIFEEYGAFHIITKITWSYIEQKFPDHSTTQQAWVMCDPEIWEPVRHDTEYQIVLL